MKWLNEKKWGVPSKYFERLIIIIGFRYKLIRIGGEGTKFIRGKSKFSLRCCSKKSQHHSINVTIGKFK